MSMPVRKFFRMSMKLALAMFAFLLIATAALALFPLVVATDPVGMRTALDAWDTPLAVLRLAVYGAVIWFLPARMRMPADQRWSVRIRIAVVLVIAEVLVVDQAWSVF